VTLFPPPSSEFTLNEAGGLEIFDVYVMEQQAAGTT